MISKCLLPAKAFIIYCAISFLAFSASGQSLAYRAMLSTLYDSDFPVIYPNEIERLSKYQILDTREKEEYEVSHLDGAICVGYDDFSEEVFENLNPERPVLVYCSVGARSQDIGKKLVQEGFNVVNLYGGIFQWVNDGFPVYDSLGKTEKVHAYNRAWGVWLNKGEKVY
ncbi:MAG: rhodanese-like domain-containing protein [Cyclobacteriaceae bacterium]|uniref:Rhodanese-like domain-containing protein n=1 Tax=Algoriphagus marincola TaxID=264027 RepID=A0ABS7N0B7_9BACT|nr:rhodanese-like domain-containing protein [Algoriphagus marincola]MBY5949747.1 rhodanese-like domain-containing protein [Algoriphagus marincola]MCR9081047.1 rhodanese-like domain-containing protein [Cyclobacteriaceae bacterium]